MVAYPDGVGASVRSTPTTLELVLVPPLVKTVTNCVLVIVAGRGIELVIVAGRGIELVIVPGRGIELVMVAGRGIELVLNVEGNKTANKTW